MVFYREVFNDDEVEPTIKEVIFEDGIPLSTDLTHIRLGYKALVEGDWDEIILIGRSEMFDKKIKVRMYRKD